ncbi:radical SAM protein [Candidatus Saganbacteria bacterium]|nr:radical SAM protein [Candidatus Saganbacteria bacterium]
MPGSTVAPQVAGPKVFAHPRTLRDAVIFRRDALPLHLEVDLTTNCNSRCPHCTFQDTDKDYILDSWVFNRVILDASGMGLRAVTFTGGGEPTLNPEFAGMVQNVRALGLKAGLITNGLAFSPEMAEKVLPHLSWVRFSLDAGSPEMYGKTHGLNKKAFSRLIDNIQKAAQTKRGMKLSTSLGASYLVLESDPVDFKRAVELGRAMGLDYVQFKPMQLRNPSAVGGYSYNIPVLCEAVKHLRQLVDQDYGEAFHVYFTRFCPQLLDAGQLEHRKSVFCFGQQLTTSLAADGFLYACCHHKYDPDFELGDLRTDDFRTIWTSEKREKFFYGMNPQKRCLPDCRFADLNERFWEEYHTNFLSLRDYYEIWEKAEMDTNNPTCPDSNLFV